MTSNITIYNLNNKLILEKDNVKNFIFVNEKIIKQLNASRNFFFQLSIIKGWIGSVSYYNNYQDKKFVLNVENLKNDERIELNYLEDYLFFKPVCHFYGTKPIDKCILDLNYAKLSDLKAITSPMDYHCKLDYIPHSISHLTFLNKPGFDLHKELSHLEKVEPNIHYKIDNYMENFRKNNSHLLNNF